MPHPSESALIVLLALRLRTVADEAAVAEVGGLRVDDVHRELDALAAGDLVRHRDGRVTGWMLTPAGRDAVATRLADELDEALAREAVTTAYARFLTVNQPLLDLCTRWQVRTVDGVDTTNDHTDAAYDGEILGALGPVDDTASEVCAALGQHLARFDGYRARLDDARARVVAGDAAALTGSDPRSYHSTWFELHENLLATLGLERGHEPLGATTSTQETR
jgi:hypothetical protein